MASAVELAERVSKISVKTWLRRVLLLLSILAVLGLGAQFGILLWAENGFSAPEAVVGTQSMMLARNGTLYYDLNNYPYTVCAYTPIFYVLEAGLYVFGLPVFTAGRLISFLALLGIIGLSWRILILYTRDHYYAWTGALLCASSALLLFWGSAGQVDTLAVFLALAAFERFSSFSIEGQRTLVWAGLFVLLAFFTKQTMIACPAAVVGLLCLDRRWKIAGWFGGGTAAVSLGIILVLNTVTRGHFLANTVLANMNPFAAAKLGDHLRYLFLTAGPLMIIVAAGCARVLRAPKHALFVYLGFALCVFTVTAPKIGSDLNYQIESTILLIICACIVLHSLDFFRLVQAGSKSWITLLQLPLGVVFVLNLVLSGRQDLLRVLLEQQQRKTTALLKPYFSGGGTVLSGDYNAAARLGGRMEIETLIYRILVDAKAVTPEPVRRDIAREHFQAIILGADVNGRKAGWDPEIAGLPDSQVNEIRKHYRLARSIHDNLQDLFVYTPAGVPETQ